MRRAGCALSAGERIVGAAAVSIPVLQAVAAVSILVPESRLTPEVLRRYVALLKNEIRLLSIVVPVSAPSSERQG